jgi:hypothetical protein
MNFLSARVTRLAAAEVRSRHQIPVIGCTGISAQEFDPAGLDNHWDRVMATHRPGSEGLLVLIDSRMV